MKDLYLTSTFTNPWNVEFNPKMGKALEDSNFNCYLPHRDTNQKASTEDIFNSDLNGIKNSKCILAISLNESPNWGAEIGYAYSQNKPIIALTDNTHEIPLICNGMVTEVYRVEDLNDISVYISDLTHVINKYL